jgi:hypothetical protein
MIFLHEGGLNRILNEFDYRAATDFVVKLSDEVSGERRPAGGTAFLRNEVI